MANSKAKASSRTSRTTGKMLPTLAICSFLSMLSHISKELPTALETNC